MHSQVAFLCGNFYYYFFLLLVRHPRVDGPTCATTSFATKTESSAEERNEGRRGGGSGSVECRREEFTREGNRVGIEAMFPSHILLLVSGPKRLLVCGMARN